LKLQRKNSSIPTAGYSTDNPSINPFPSIVVSEGFSDITVSMNMLAELFEMYSGKSLIKQLVVLCRGNILREKIEAAILTEI
jgi:hypothetical protein